MSQATNPLELPISGQASEIELKIESETHKYFDIQNKRLKLTRPLDRDAILKEVSFLLAVAFSNKRKIGFYLSNWLLINICLLSYIIEFY